MTTVAVEIHDAGVLVVDESGATSAAGPGYALWENGRIVAGQAAWRRAREKPRWIHHRFWQDLDTTPLGRPFPRDLSHADLAHAHLSEIRKLAPFVAPKGDKRNAAPKGDKRNAAPKGDKRNAAAGEGKRTVVQEADAGIDRVLLAVPGCFSARQLGLILGIARSCGLPVAGLIDLAAAAIPVATAAAGHPSRRILHLDIHLHRLVLTELEMSVPNSGAPKSLSRPPPGKTWATVLRRRVNVIDDAGLVVLQQTWAQRIAELFVQATRYDPQHSARAEQTLYNRLPKWLDSLRSGEIIEATLGPKGEERSVELKRPDLVAAAEPFYDRFLELVLGLQRAGESVTLLLARSITELPGLEPRLAELRGVATIPLPAGAGASGALLVEEQVRAATESGSDPTSGLPLITRLSFKTPAAAATRDQGKTKPAVELTRRRPTHLLHDGLAYPITERPFHLGLALDGEPGLELEGRTAGISRSHCSVLRRGAAIVVENHSTYGSLVNGKKVHGQATLRAGDRLRLGTDPGIELELIAVVEANGTP